MCLFCIKRKPHFFMWRDWLRIILKSFSSTLKKWRKGPTSGAEQNPQPSEISSCSLGRPTFPAFQMKCFRFDWSPTWSISAPELNHLHQPGRHATGELSISVAPKSLGWRIYTLLSLFWNNFSFQKRFPIFSILEKKTTTLIQGDITVEGKLNKGLPAPKPMKS